MEEEKKDMDMIKRAEELADGWLEGYDDEDISLTEEDIDESVKELIIDSELSEDVDIDELAGHVSEVIIAKIEKMREGKKKYVSQERNNVTTTLVTDTGENDFSFSCKARLLKEIIKRVLVINDEISIDIQKDCWIIKQVDISHVAMVMQMIPRKEFYTGEDVITKKICYNFKEDITIGINADKLNKTLKLWSNYDIIHGEIKNNTLYLKDEDNDIQRKQGLIEVSEGMKMPSLNLTISCETKNCHVLQKAMSGSDAVTLESNGKTLIARFEDEDGDTTKILLSKEPKGKGKAVYDSEWLGKILSLYSGFYQRIQIRFDTDNPIEIVDKIREIETKYLLAPRIESE